MGSSSSSDFSEPPRGPNPPAGMISPQGQSTPFKPHFTNFLGDTNVPSRGLTPEMLAEIAGSNGPAPGAMPPGAGAGAGAAAAPSGDPKRQQLAALLMRLQQPPERGYGMPPGGGSGHGGGGGMGGGWGGK